MSDCCKITVSQAARFVLDALHAGEACPPPWVDVPACPCDGCQECWAAFLEGQVRKEL